MENSACKRIVAKDGDDNAIDPDYSLDEFFNADWSWTDNETSENIEYNVSAKSNTGGEDSSRTTENTDPDYTLDKYFDEEWSYNAKTNKNLLPTVIRNDYFANYQNKSKKVDTQQQKISVSSVIDIIKFGTIPAFKNLIKSNSISEVLNEKSQTAIHKLYDSRDWEGLEVLDRKFSRLPAIQQPPFNNINNTDCHGLTHLHIACARGSLLLVDRFLHDDDDINASYNGDSSHNYAGFTALHFAIRNPKVHKKEIVQKLIKRGADVNATDSKGRTPLHLASRIFKKERYEQCDRKVILEIIDILLKSQSHIEARDADGNTPLLNVFSQAYHEFTLKPYGWDSCLPHNSVYMPETKARLKLFLQRGADVTASNVNNDNVLHLILKNLKTYRLKFKDANYIFDDSDHLDMIKQILFAKPKIDFDLKNDEGETPLQMAVACLSPKIVELLLDHGADLTGLKFEVKGHENKFFCYPDMVVIFEPMQDLIDLLDRLSSRDFNLSLQDKKLILEFLLHNKDEDEPCSCGDGIDSDIKCVLEYGSNSHVEHILRCLHSNLYDYEDPEDPYFLDQYCGIGFRGTEKLCSDLKKYLDIRESGHIYSDKGVEIIASKIVSILIDRFEDASFISSYDLEKDLNSLKAIKFENKVSLHDVLVKNPLNTPRSTVNEFRVELIQDLHCYKDAVKGHFTKARVRHLLEDYSSDYFKLISDFLPDVCCRMIVYYLSNQDILNLCLATIIDD